MPVRPQGDYASGAFRELERRAGKTRQAAMRESSESMAGQGRISSGAVLRAGAAADERANEQYFRGSQEIENRTFAAGEAEKQRIHATGEREGSQVWQSGENVSQRDMQMKLQEMGDVARHELQQLVIDGKMTMQEADQAWQYEQNDLNRKLDEWMTSGQWRQEKELQGGQFAQERFIQGGAFGQEQWMAEFGAGAALALQNDVQNFDEFMAQLGRAWDLKDRPWQEQMWLMDAQLQMAVSGHNWWRDDLTGGPPAWMSEEDGGPGYLGDVDRTRYTYSSGPPGRRFSGQ